MRYSYTRQERRKHADFQAAAAQGNGQCNGSDKLQVSQLSLVPRPRQAILLPKKLSSLEAVMQVFMGSLVFALNCLVLLGIFWVCFPEKAEDKFLNT